MGGLWARGNGCHISQQCEISGSIPEVLAIRTFA
nr:MAG TPA: hypothetical protein [Herelleviridae sp.]DAV56463.1 MAG TPA: hypothetical protein [Bacteriophage sp.]DAW36821.1 MAG TPA: hypothetical protein [Caudoviricetes sp.]